MKHYDCLQCYYSNGERAEIEKQLRRMFSAYIEIVSIVTHKMPAARRGGWKDFADAFHKGGFASFVRVVCKVVGVPYDRYGF